MEALPYFNEQELLSAVRQVMPFGKYKGRALLELPEPYLVWFHQEGFPDSKLGQQLALIYEIKVNGLEAMLKTLLAKADV
ncbi:MAG: DUF3820 family protein [Kangiellaceae bacterium]|jgi:uncharacterized protein (DUF3820 family)|nr:DUF3820 family protein [Kangiellaceae bacterium]